MKIVHISHLYHPSQGGVQFFFKNVSERLVKDYGDDVTVVTTDSLYGPERKIYKNAGPASELINGVKVLRFPYQRWHIKPYRFAAKVLKKINFNMPASVQLLANGPISPSMKEYLLNVDADAICASSSGYMFMRLPLWRKCNFFYFGSIHLSENDRPTLEKIQLDSINASTLYFANTQFEKERMIQAGVRKELIYVLGVGVDMEPFLDVDEFGVTKFRQQLDLPVDALLVGYVGRIETPKNVIALINAFELVAQKFPNAYLLLAGSGNEYVHVLKNYCNNLFPDVTKRIRWVINFSAELKPVIFHALDVFVLPSHNESFGIVFLEAWSCRKPVIGAAIGAVKNVINEGEDGLIMQVDDKNSLAEKIEELLLDEGKRKSFGENGFTKVKNNFTWDLITSRLRQCYINAGKPVKNLRTLSNV